MGSDGESLLVAMVLLPLWVGSKLLLQVGEFEAYFIRVLFISEGKTEWEIDQ